MKLFTTEIERRLQAQFELGSDLEHQEVICKIFNPYGNGTWYVVNQDPDNPDYLWGIACLMEVEVGSFNKKELSMIRIRPFGLALERDLCFHPINAEEAYTRLKAGEHL